MKTHTQIISEDTVSENDNVLNKKWIKNEKKISNLFYFVYKKYPSCYTHNMSQEFV